MGRLPPRSTRDLEQLLEAFGFRYHRERGPHDVWVHRTRRTVSLPRNGREGEIPVGTVKGILHRAGISREDALRFWGIEE